MSIPRDNTPWRTSPLPPGWRRQIRPPVLERDGGQCTWVEDDGQRCTLRATDVDHIGDPNDHGPENLRSLCGYHHRKRTAAQANAAKGPAPSRRRPAEAHPGLVTQPSIRARLDAGRRAAKRGEDIPPF